MARIALLTPDHFNRQDERLCLQAKGHNLLILKDLSSGFDAIFSDPPDLVIIQKGQEKDIDQQIVVALKNNLQMTLMPILLLVSERDLSAGLDWNRYPVDDLIPLHAPMEEILTRIDLAINRARRVADNNPLTKLPGNSSILKTIQQALDSGKNFAVAYVDIDNFKPFNDKYGFSRGDEVIRMVARILVNVIQETVKQESFVGHIGGDDFVFLLPLPDAKDQAQETMKQVCQAILQNFAALIPLFIDEEDIERGFFISKDRLGNEQRFPLTSLSIAVVPCPPGRFDHYGHVAETAAQLKKAVKKLEGNNFLIDRRSHAGEEEKPHL